MRTKTTMRISTSPASPRTSKRSILVTNHMGRVHQDAAHCFWLYAPQDKGPSQVNSRGPGCVRLVLRLINTSAGIAGKDFGEIRSLWPETVIAFPTAPSAMDSGTNCLPIRMKTRWLLWLEDTSNGRVSPCSSSASNPIAMLIKRNYGAPGIAASICASSTPIDKEHF